MPDQSSRPTDWIEEILAREANRILRTAIAITGSKDDAEDIVQEVFLKLYEKRPAFESQEHETAWLVRVTVNICKSRLRSPWRKKTVPLLETWPAKTDAQQGLIETVQRLPAKYRAVIHLFYYEGYKTKEIAGITGQKESTVREQLTRARRLLKDFLDEDEWGREEQKT